MWFRRGPLRAGHGISSSTEGISDVRGQNQICHHNLCWSGTLTLRGEVLLQLYFREPFEHFRGELFPATVLQLKGQESCNEYWNYMPPGNYLQSPEPFKYNNLPCAMIFAGRLRCLSPNHCSGKERTGRFLSRRGWRRWGWREFAGVCGKGTRRSKDQWRTVPFHWMGSRHW